MSAPDDQGKCVCIWHEERIPGEPHIPTMYSIEPNPDCPEHFPKRDRDGIISVLVHLVPEGWKPEDLEIIADGLLATTWMRPEVDEAEVAQIVTRVWGGNTPGFGAWETARELAERRNEWIR